MTDQCWPKIMENRPFLAEKEEGGSVSRPQSVTLMRLGYMYPGNRRPLVGGQVRMSLAQLV